MPGKKKLEELIVAPMPVNPDVRLVKHGEEKAFVIASVPDYMAEAAMCAGKTRGQDIEFKPGDQKIYGNYYALGFRLKDAGPEAAVLWTVWTKTESGWRIVTYAVITP
jgi:hypothetical protein